MIFITSDHGGFSTKKQIVEWLKDKNLDVTDLGPTRFKKNDDYPIWAKRLALAIKRHPQSLGLAVCRSGIGMSIATNKFSGIRCAQALNPAMAKASRRDENSNVLSLAADYFSLTQIKKMVLIWLQTSYRPNRRFDRRLRELKKLEHGS